MTKEVLEIEPAPGRVLIKITQSQIESLTSRWITRDDGSKVKLFTEPEYKKGYDRKFMQNVSIGTVLAVGEGVDKIVGGDIILIDYLVTNNIDVFVGYFNNDIVCAVLADTTTFNEDSLPSKTGRLAWMKGDYNDISPIIGVIRDNELMAFDPYIILETKTTKIVKVLANGKLIESEERISTRTVLSAPEDSWVKQGDEITTETQNLFGRYVNGKEVSVIFKNDILTKTSAIK